jgi:low density lipoprotein receptor adapter protein 1
LFPAFRISNCSADAAHDHVFAFVAKNTNETMECHAFLCPKRKIVSENKIDLQVT